LIVVVTDGFADVCSSVLSKGYALQKIAVRAPFMGDHRFVVAAGDGLTDEAMFEFADVGIKFGREATMAGDRVSSHSRMSAGVVDGSARGCRALIGGKFLNSNPVCLFEFEFPMINRALGYPIHLCNHAKGSSLFQSGCQGIQAVVVDHVTGAFSRSARHHRRSNLSTLCSRVAC
jgi:hypothetical protein